MSTLKKISSKSDQTLFDKNVLSAIQHLHPYVKHRLYIAVSTRILPKNMFTSTDIIDDGIIELYSSDISKSAEVMEIKLKLFKIIDNQIDDLFKKEAFHKKTISTDTILKSELNKLNEDYTVDADLDFILNTELNDISYQQDNADQLLLYSDYNTNIIQSFEVEDISNKHTPELLSKFYTLLPLNISNILDLFTFGKLSYEDIAKIKNIEIKHVEYILTTVITNYRKNLL